MTKITKKLSNMRRENKKSLQHQLCFAEEKLRSSTTKKHMAVQWNLMNPQGKEWNLLYLQHTKITLQVSL